MIKHTEEFKQKAVRIALTSGLPRDRVASDLGIGKSTLASGSRIIGLPIWWQRRRRIWDARMNASALKTVCSGRRG